MENEINNQDEDLKNDTGTDEQSAEHENDTEDADTNEEGEDIDFYKAEAAKYKRMAEQNKKKLQKASSEEKSTSKGSFNTNLTPFDLVAVAKADLDEEGLQEVMDYAKFKNISISEALKSSVVKATLAEKAEYKKSAEATYTTGSRKGVSKVSDSSLLENARKGILPDSDEDMMRLISLRRKNK